MWTNCIKDLFKYIWRNDINRRTQRFKLFYYFLKMGARNGFKLTKTTVKSGGEEDSEEDGVIASLIEK